VPERADADNADSNLSDDAPDPAEGGNEGAGEEKPSPTSELALALSCSGTILPARR
jgi:hypothetical protein